jgi:hypothetical protein
MSTITLLSLPSQQPAAIDQKDLERVLTRPLLIGQSGPALIISSQRDQIEVVSAGNMLNVRDLSGKSEFSESKVPTVLDFFFTLSTPRLLSSYGVNFIISVPRSEPGQWVRDNILAAQISVKTQKTLLGGSAMLKIAADPKTWNIKLEPREDNKISVDFNASEDTQELPDPAALRQEMREQFESMLRFLTELGL